MRTSFENETFENWDVLRRFLPEGWEEQARLCGAMRRARYIKDCLLYTSRIGRIAAAGRRPGDLVPACLLYTSSLTARGPLAARASAASDVAFRPLGRRRHPGLMISRLNNPAYVSLCQRFACALTGADA